MFCKKVKEKFGNMIKMKLMVTNPKMKWDTNDQNPSNF